jgi:type II secretory pathway component GspD/PulD (secretin)
MKMSRIALVTVLAVCLAAMAAHGAEEKFMKTEPVKSKSVDLSFDFKQAKFADVIGYIAEKSGRNIVLEGTVEETVTLRLTGINWRKALDLVCEQVKAVIEEQGDVIRISKPPTVTLSTTPDASIVSVVNSIARIGGSSVIVGPGVTGTVSAQLYDVPWTKALDYIVRTNGFVVLREDNVFRVMDPTMLETQLVTKVLQLRYIQPPAAYKAVIESKFAREEKSELKTVTGTGEQLGGAGVSLLPTLSGARAAQAASSGGAQAASADFPLLAAVQKIASKKGTVNYVPSTNSLIITDTEPNVKAISELIESVDKEPVQVFIDVKFVSTSLNHDFRFGVNWANGLNIKQTYGSVISLLPFARSGNWATATSVHRNGPTDADIAAGIADYTAQNGPYTFGLLDFRQTQQTIEALASDANTELVQSPQLLLLDNHQGTIFVGETVRFAQTDSASNQAGGVQTGIIEAPNSPIDTGFQLLVRPHVVAGDDKILLDVIPKAEQLSGTSTKYPGFDEFTNGTASIQLPRVQSSTLVTKLMMDDAQTAVLGGMITESEGKTVHKVPFVGDIPGLGWAFKWEQKTRTKKNLLIFITVRVVHNHSDVQEIYTVYGDKYGGKIHDRMVQEDEALWKKTKERGYDVKIHAKDREPVKPKEDMGYGS